MDKNNLARIRAMMERRDLVLLTTFEYFGMGGVLLAGGILVGFLVGYAVFGL